MSLLSSLKSMLSSGSESLTSSFFGLLKSTAVDLMDRSMGLSWSMAMPATAGECSIRSPPFLFCQVIGTFLWCKGRNVALLGE